jgi:hypothetical protein
MMKVNCIHCGHAFGVDESYSDYEGLLRCGTCAGLLDVRIADGLIRAVRPGSLHAPAQPASFPASPRTIEAPEAPPEVDPAAPDQYGDRFAA